MMDGLKRYLTGKSPLTMINKYSNYKGVEIGNIRIFDTDTKFEVEEQSAEGLVVDISKLVYNGIPLEVKALPASKATARRREEKHRGGFSSRRERRDRERREARRKDAGAPKRRGRPGSNPKKPRNFNRSSAWE